MPLPEHPVHGNFPKSVFAFILFEQEEINLLIHNIYTSQRLDCINDAHVWNI